jgi:hypothetical protein
MGVIIARCRLGTLSVGEKNYRSRPLLCAAVTGGSFTATLWQVHFNESEELLNEQFFAAYLKEIPQ